MTAPDTAGAFDLFRTGMSRDTALSAFLSAGIVDKRYFHNHRELGWIELK